MIFFKCTYMEVENISTVLGHGPDLCKCKHSKKRKKKKVYYYYENIFDLVDALKGSRGPLGSMGHL